jgi:hypothetical protein
MTVLEMVGHSLQRHVGVLLPRVLLFLASQQVQILADSPAGGSWFNDVIDIAADGSRERVTKLFDVLLLLLDGALACW